MATGDAAKLGSAIFNHKGNVSAALQETKKSVCGEHLQSSHDYYSAKYKAMSEISHTADQMYNSKDEPCPKNTTGQQQSTSTLGLANGLVSCEVYHLEICAINWQSSNQAWGVMAHLYAVALHTYKETGGQLRPWCASVEEGRGRVGEPALTKHVVCLDDALDISLVHAHRHSHEHVLRSLHHFAIHPQEV